MRSSGRSSGCAKSSVPEDLMGVLKAGLRTSGMGLCLGLIPKICGGSWSACINARLEDVKNRNTMKHRSYGWSICLENSLGIGLCRKPQSPPLRSVDTDHLQ